MNKLKDVTFLNNYNESLMILDKYDHMNIDDLKGTKDIQKLEYNNCRAIIDNCIFNDGKSLFGQERDDSFQSSINAIYQSVFGDDLYSTLELKAANLLYYVTKNHSFIDGNKRIAAIMFLYFLNINDALYINGKERIAGDALVSLTILIASSKPEDKESIINLILLLIN